MEAFADVLETTELTAYEIERGKPMPDIIHGAIQANLSFDFKTRYRASLRVVLEVTLDIKPAGTTPDLLVYHSFRLDYDHRTARFTTPPLLIIEIQSPSQSLEVMVEKTAVYFAFGVKSCWVILPSIRAVMVYSAPERYRFFHDDETLHDATLNLDVPLSAVFE